MWLCESASCPNCRKDVQCKEVRLINYQIACTLYTIIDKPKKALTHISNIDDTSETSSKVIELQGKLALYEEKQKTTEEKHNEIKDELLKYKKILVVKLNYIKDKEQEIEALEKTLAELQTVNNKLRRDNIELTNLSRL
jgi:paraquat-inducible protein B